MFSCIAAGWFQNHAMPGITTDAPRLIIDDFAKIIRERKTKGPKPETAVINFRNEKRDQVERPVELVPVNLLRYRKDNGRIASDVSDYETRNGPLHEADDQAQAVLRKFLEEKDPEKTDDLVKSIQHTGQDEPAIITCDGFLINGNRRKMGLEKLKQLDPGGSKYDFMKVVILPGPGDSGGRPTLREIEELENRYQLQTDGKSEYYGFDRALSIKRKIEIGYSLKDQLKDDPRYVRATEKEIAQAIKDIQQNYLRPLECVDRYLRLFGREGLYGTVSSSRGDREGRWQAFLDYSQAYYSYFRDPEWMMKKGVDEEDIGGLEDAVFKIIRLRNLHGLRKLHQLMRDLRKLAGYKESRKELLKISDEVDPVLREKECFDDKGQRLSIEKVDERWAEKNQQTIIHHLKKALDHQERNQGMETPIGLLKAALQKLNHDSMTVKSIGVSDYAEARQLTSAIQRRAKDIEAEIYQAHKEFQGLPQKR
jgi:hypothetical protein